jgi:chromosome segregation ATPase
VHPSITIAPVRIQTLEKGNEIKFKEKIEKLKARLIEQEKALVVEKKAKTKLEDELQKCRVSLHDGELERGRLTREIESLKRDKTMLESEQDSIQTQLLDATRRATVSQDNKREKKLECKIRGLNRANAELSERVRCAESEVQPLREKVSEQTLVIEKLTNETDHLRRQIADFESEKQLKLRTVVKHEAAPAGMVPLEIPIPSETPSDIAVLIREIAGRPSAQYQTKIQAVLSTMVQQFMKKIGDITLQMQTAERKRDSILGLLETLVKTVAQVIDGEDSLISQYVENQSRRTALITKLNVFKENFHKVTCEKNQLEGLLGQVVERLNVNDYSGVIPAINTLHNDFGNISTVLEEAKLQTKRIKKENASVRLEADSSLQQLSQQLASLQADFDSLILKHRECEKQNKYDQTIQRDQAGRIESLQKDISEMKITHEGTLRDESIRHQDHIQMIQCQYQNNISEYQAQIQQITHELTEEKRQKSILKRAISVLKQKVGLSEENIQTIRKESETATALLKQRFEEELKNLKAINNETISQLTSKNTELTTTIERITESLRTLEAKNTTLAKDARSLRRKNSHLESQLASQTESSNRERQLAEAQLKSTQLSVETKAQSMIAGAKAEAQREMAKLIGIFTEEFRHFVDPFEPVDSTSFPAMVRKARAEMTKLNDELLAIRCVVNPLPGQPLQDAVAQAVCGAA